MKQRLTVSMLGFLYGHLWVVTHVAPLNFLPWECYHEHLGLLIQWHRDLQWPNIHQDNTSGYFFLSATIGRCDFFLHGPSAVHSKPKIMFHPNCHRHTPLNKEETVFSTCSKQLPLKICVSSIFPGFKLSQVLNHPKLTT